MKFSVSSQIRDQMTNAILSFHHWNKMRFAGTQKVHLPSLPQAQRSHPRQETVSYMCDGSISVRPDMWKGMAIALSHNPTPLMRGDGRQEKITLRNNIRVQSHKNERQKAENSLAKNVLSFLWLLLSSLLTLSVQLSFILFLGGGQVDSFSLFPFLFPVQSFYFQSCPEVRIPEKRRDCKGILGIECKDIFFVLFSLCSESLFVKLRHSKSAI
ncbi:hypothetical protein CDAR_604321 [Caerostris darwini]|uniref:Uncharacterized protein n=1 Tax=Caerostris darwini TaxID=1538125 RepID=A0AAV4T2V3_9ARAC|nr:hypothetical protein CDAR_604321 [Caerostris darwini]